MPGFSDQIRLGGGRGDSSSGSARLRGMARGAPCRARAAHCPQRVRRPRPRRAHTAGVFQTWQQGVASSTGARNKREAPRLAAAGVVGCNCDSALRVRAALPAALPVGCPLPPRAAGGCGAWLPPSLTDV